MRIEDPRLHWLDVEAESVSKVGTQRHREGMLRDRERQRTRNCTWKAKEECFTKQTAIGVR